MLAGHKYKVLRKKFCDLHAKEIEMWPDVQIDQVILCPFLLIKKGFTYEKISEELIIRPNQTEKYVGNGMIMLHKTFDPINVMNNEKMLRNEDLMATKQKRPMQGVSVYMDHTRVELEIDGEKFILFLVANAVNKIEFIELQIFEDNRSDESLLLETDFFNVVVELQTLQFKCRNGKCLHIRGKIPNFCVSILGDKKYGLKNYICLNILDSIITAFAHKLNSNGEKCIEKSKNDFNRYLNLSRLVIESLCNIKNYYTMYSMKNTLPCNFNYKIAAMLSGQMMNASHSHFYFDDEELQQHECTRVCFDYIPEIKVTVCGPEDIVKITGEHYLKDMHLCIMNRCPAEDDDLLLLLEGCDKLE